MEKEGVSPKRKKRENEGDIQFKVIIVGDSGVGKSCFLARYIKGIFIDQYHVTLGAQFETKTVHIDDLKVKLQIWDTAGQQTFRSIVKSFYRNSSAVLLVFNLTNKNSFSSLAGWLKEAKQSAPLTSEFILVGTHSDLITQRAVSKAEVEKFKEENGVTMSFETSAKDDSNVTTAFEEIAALSFQNYMQRYEKRKSSQGIPNRTVKITQNSQQTPAQKQQEGCC